MMPPSSNGSVRRNMATRGGGHRQNSKHSPASPTRTVATVKGIVGEVYETKRFTVPPNVWRDSKTKKTLSQNSCSPGRSKTKHSQTRNRCGTHYTLILSL